MFELRERSSSCHIYHQITLELAQGTLVLWALGDTPNKYLHEHTLTDNAYEHLREQDVNITRVCKTRCKSRWLCWLQYEWSFAGDYT